MKYKFLYAMPGKQNVPSFYPTMPHGKCTLFPLALSTRGLKISRGVVVDLTRFRIGHNFFFAIPLNLY